MAKILYLAQLLPYPADAGPKVRIYHVLRHLAQRHEVTLLAFNRPDDPPQAQEHLRQFCAAVHTVPMVRSRSRDLRALLLSLLKGGSFIIQRDESREMIQKVNQLLSEQTFDAVHADQLWMAQYALQARGIRRVLDEHNACFQIFQRLAQGEKNPLKRIFLEWEWRRLKAYEMKTCARFDQMVTVTEEDRRTLQSGSRPGPEYSVIPICIDPEQTSPVTPHPGARDILHLGTMFWLPNVEGVLWFAQQVWPQVRSQVPGVTFTIIGKRPPEAVRALATAGGVRVTGYIADPRPFLEAAAAFVVPLHSGSGMRVKILDAWSWGLPVISTRTGAEGIRYIDGENILIADTPEQFAQAVVRVLCDPQLAQRLRENGRRWVETQYNWRRVYEAWDEIYP